MVRNDLRNVAIIAHVDHGKTTLVDALLKQSHAFRENQAVEERVMDSNDLERERGITILAKNTSVHYNGVKINIVDTPGHADFSGEVERVMMMVNGVLVLVDAAEGPMPQTRFVVQKALEMGHRLIIVVNKIDRPDARLAEVQDEILELLLELDASDDQLMSPVVWCSGRNGTATLDLNTPGKDLTPLFDTILSHIQPMEVDEKGGAQLLVSSIDYNDYVGRIGIGRIERGEILQGQAVTVTNYNNQQMKLNGKIANLYQIDGLNRVPCERAIAGDIVCFSGLEKINIGDTGVLARLRRSAQVRKDFRTYGRDDFLCKRFSLRGQGRQVGNYPPPARQTVPRASERCFSPRGRDRLGRQLPRVRQGRNAPFHTHRKYAQGGLRISGIHAPRAVQRD